MLLAAAYRLNAEDCSSSLHSMLQCFGIASVTLQLPTMLSPDALCT